MDRILAKICSMEKKLDKIEEIEKSMVFISAEFDKQRKELLQFQQEKRAMNKKIDELENRLKAQEGVVQEIDTGFEDMQNETKKRNAEITGIPEQLNEDLRGCVKKIAIKVGVGFNESDLVFIQRKKNKSKEGSSIIAGFTNEVKRNAFIQQSRKAKVTTGDIVAGNAQVGNKPIYVNEDITWQTRRSFALARAFKRDNQYAFCWVKNARVYLKKSQDSAAIWIKRPSDLKKLEVN